MGGLAMGKHSMESKRATRMLAIAIAIGLAGCTWSAAAQVKQPAPIEQRAEVAKVLPGPGIAQRVAVLRSTAATFRRVAASIPKDAPAAEAASAQRYAAWLDAKARELDALADLGQASAGNAKQLQEQQMSFNLQYLQLQSQMQHENRSYTAISNIMKTKHDTVKNSISNVR
jgi:hypothetical protein